MIFRILWFVFMYLVSGTVIAGVCIAILGDDADRYENKVVTLAILIWPVMLVILVLGVLTGIAIRIGTPARPTRASRPPQHAAVSAGPTDKEGKDE